MQSSQGGDPPPEPWLGDSRNIGARDAGEGPRVLLSLRVDFGSMGYV